MLIGMLGRKGTGKDTAADYLVKNYEFNKTAFAKPLKDACLSLFYFENDQLYSDKKEIKDSYWNVKPRDVMQFLGTDVFQYAIQEIIPHISNDFWVKSMKHPRNGIDYTKNIVFCDVRFDNEIKAIQDMGGFVIKLVNNKIEKGDHIAESGVDELNGDYEILNNYNPGQTIEQKQYSLQRLYRQLDEIIESIKDKKK